MTVIRWETSSKGCLVPVVNGYRYRIKSKTEKTKYWTCIKQSCATKLHTYDLKSYKVIGEHNHPLD